MIVVCDTTPINYLVQIGLVDLIPRLYGTAFIPPSVLAELLHPKAPSAVSRWALSPPEWLIARGSAPVAQLVPGLHRGEQDAISLAEHLHARILLTDDFRARSVAHRRGIETVTTLLMLDVAADRGWITFKDAVERLLLTNFRVDRLTIDQLLEKHQGNQPSG